MNLLEKQSHAVYYLQDTTTHTVNYGGAAGGGKSAVGVLWLQSMCQQYPGTRWLMGRAKLTTLKGTTLKTFFEIASKLGIADQYEYKQQEKAIVWKNGSEIILKDLFYYPSDPEYDELGSLEITGAFIDEGAQITERCYQVVCSRIRFKIDDPERGIYHYGLSPKVLITCNPHKGWIYEKFYRPWRAKTLPAHLAFIRALPTDNPHLPQSYLDSLLRLEHNLRQKLYYGDWEFDDPEDALIEYDAIQDLFFNDHVDQQLDKRKYLTADIATVGSDLFVIMVWEGLKVIHKLSVPKSTGKEVVDIIKETARKYAVPRSSCIYDSDGSKTLTGYLDGMRGFSANERPTDAAFLNMKAQCYYKLAELINESKIWIAADIETTVRDAIVQELEYVKKYRTDEDGKLRTLPKKEIKGMIGRSPDYADTLMMRMWFLVRRSVQY